jgi:ATP-dependent RNA helicase RhlE
MHFQDLKLHAALLDAVRAEGYETPTPIQEQAIPLVLTGKDLMGCAKTGTGKTAAFALPILDTLLRVPVPNGRRNPRVLVLTPTRELAAQVADNFARYGGRTRLRTTVIFGGVSQHAQEIAIRGGCDILVATPGRLLDLCGQRLLSLASIEIFVLDEADRMLDMGFINDIRKVVAMLPPTRQNLMFSATFADDIKTLAGSILKAPEFVAADPPATTVELITQQLCFVERAQKIDLLLHFLKDPRMRRVLAFTRTKHGADKVVRQLDRVGIKALAIHGNKSQNARTHAMDEFRKGGTRVMVATDIAARGIDIDDITHVVIMDLPNEPDIFVHRIGRTGRAGEAGIAIAFCAEDERPLLADIERLIGKHVPRMEDYPFVSPIAPPSPTNLTPQKRTSPSVANRPSGRPGNSPYGHRPGGPGRADNHSRSDNAPRRNQPHDQNRGKRPPQNTPRPANAGR